MTLLLRKGELSIDGQLRAVFVDIAFNQGKITAQLLDANQNTSSEQLAAIFCEAAEKGCKDLVHTMLSRYIISIQTQMKAIDKAEKNEEKEVVSFLTKYVAANATRNTSQDDLVCIFSWAASEGDIRAF